MRKLIYLMAISATAFAFQGCNSTDTDAKDTADSINMAKDTTSDPMATSGIAVEQSDADFATSAAVSGMAEVELGKLALTKGTNASVKSFAEMMVSDHGKANEELMGIANMKNITLPSVVDEKHMKIMEELRSKTGADFDKAYVDAMVTAHESTLKLMQDQSKNGKDADLSSFAAKAGPIVESHLSMVKKMQTDMK